MADLYMTDFFFKPYEISTTVRFETSEEQQAFHRWWGEIGKELFVDWATPEDERETLPDIPAKDMEALMGWLNIDEGD